jgi:hypothetical protein
MLRLKTHPLAAGAKGFLRVVENGSRRKNKNQSQRKKREAGKFRFRFGRSPGSPERFKDSLRAPLHPPKQLKK